MIMNGFRRNSVYRNGSMHFGGTEKIIKKPVASRLCEMRCGLKSKYQKRQKSEPYSH